MSDTEKTDQALRELAVAARDSAKYRMRHKCSELTEWNLHQEEVDFYKEANPDAIIAMLEERAALVEALEDAVALMNELDIGPDERLQAHAALALTGKRGSP